MGPRPRDAVALNLAQLEAFANHSRFLPHQYLATAIFTANSAKPKIFDFSAFVEDHNSELRTKENITGSAALHEPMSHDCCIVCDGVPAQVITEGQVR